MILYQSVQSVLQFATRSKITYSSILQRMNKICLRHDIGCFVMIDGGFTARTVMDFSSAAAMEIYRSYMFSVGMPAMELFMEKTEFVPFFDPE